MPDTFTHIALPALFGRFYRKSKFFPVVLLGTVLPDFLRELFKFILPTGFNSATYPFHSVLGIICVSLFFSSFFLISQRSQIFISLFIGQAIHLVFDLMQYYLNGGQLYLLLPYWQTFQMGLYSDTYWVYLFYLSLISFTIYCFLHFRKKTTD